jgi:hypothetical protein
LQDAGEQRQIPHCERQFRGELDTTKLRLAQAGELNHGLGASIAHRVEHLRPDRWTWIAMSTPVLIGHHWS